MIWEWTIGLGCVAAIAIVTACSDLASPADGVRQSSPDSLFWALTIDRKAVNLALTAPHNTVQLSAFASNANGDSLPSASGLQWVAEDSSVTVSSTGLVTSRFQTSKAEGTRVFARLTRDGVTRTDTSFIVVTSFLFTRPVLDSFYFAVPPDSAWVSSLGFGQTSVAKVFAVRARDQNRAVIPRLIVYYEVANKKIMSVGRGTGSVTGVIPGTTVLRARAMVYGVERQDSVVLSVRDPGWGLVETSAGCVPCGQQLPISGIYPSVVTIAIGGDVSWRTAAPNDSIDIIFDDPSAASSSPRQGGGTAGNIAPFVYTKDGFGYTAVTTTGGYVLRTRRFNRAGTFTYHSSFNPNWTGTIIVR